MARMLNCDNDTLTDMVYDETWYQIIKNCNHVRIPDIKPVCADRIVKDEPDDVWEIMERDGINIHSNSQFVREVCVAPAKTLLHPSDLFVIPTNKQKTENICDNYGTFVLPSLTKMPKALKRFWHYDTSCGYEYSWKEFLSKLHTGPRLTSNALILIDRYLFAYNEGCDYRNGVRNIRAILEELLPKTFSDEYHVLLVFDDTKISHYADMDKIVKAMQSIRKEIRQYIPTIEILTINKDAGHEIYSETHDRRILSNYYSLQATRGFSAFLPEEGYEKELCYSGMTYATWSQRLEFEAIYANIDNEDQDKTSLPVHFNENAIASIKQFIAGLRGDELGYKYICNGNKHVHISEIRNRLLKG